MNLFTLRNIRTGKFYSEGNWESKKAAKLKRDELNGGLSDDGDSHWNKDKGWRVTYGPAHWRCQS
jgi:hypothetical protein